MYSFYTGTIIVATAASKIKPALQSTRNIKKIIVNTLCISFNIFDVLEKYFDLLLWVAIADPYVGLARKRPKTKWRLQWAENELITYIFAVQDICSILAT